MRRRECGVRWESADLPSQIEDVRVDSPIGDGHSTTPGGLDQLVAREHTARVAREDFEQPQLLRGQLEALAAARDLRAIEVDLTVPDTEFPWSFSWRVPSKLHPNSSPQLAETERCVT